MTTEIDNYISSDIEISEGVKFSQYKLIKRLMKFKNCDLAGTKIGEDLRYEFYYDIISPRVDSEVKNLRFDTKNILVFSRNPVKDFSAVFISNASLKDWLAENGEDEKLKESVEEFSENGNVGFKKVAGGYETVDAINTYITNQKAKTVNDTDIIERHEMNASEIMAMTPWENVNEVIEYCGNKTFTATHLSTPIETTSNRYEIFEFTGEVSEKEFNEVKGLGGGDEHKYLLAKIIVAGLQKGKKGEEYILFAEKLSGKMSDHYIYAHRGRYKGRFLRVGMYETLFDHQIRANEIGNQLARGLEWAANVFFQTSDSKVLQNIRADLINGDVIIADNLTQINVRMQGLDQLIADWNRLMADADKLANSTEAVRGESPPSGTPFRTVALLDANSGKMFVTLRQKISLPFKRVFREWVLPRLVKELKGQDIFRLVGDTDMLDQFREVLVESWYAKNLVKIGPHTKEIAETIKAEKLDEMRNIDPTIENAKEIWEGVLPRLFITITGENSDAADNIQDMVNLVGLEQDPERVAYVLDAIYKIRGIPIPPRKQMQPAETQLPSRQNASQRNQEPSRRSSQEPILE